MYTVISTSLDTELSVSEIIPLCHRQKRTYQSERSLKIRLRAVREVRSFAFCKFPIQWLQFAKVAIKNETIQW